MEDIGKMRLKNKKIIVTAAAQGIGRATALAFANEGAEVIATDINSEKLDELSRLHNNISTSILDSTKKEDVASFCSQLSEIDVLFHAVGFVHNGTILDCDDDEFYNSTNINVYSAYLMCKSIIPSMIDRNKGNIIIQ